MKYSGCHLVADGLYYGVHLFGFKAYESAQGKACICLPDDKTMSTQLAIKPKQMNEIATVQSKSIYQNIYDKFSKVVSQVIDILISSPLVQSLALPITSIYKTVINFFRYVCVTYFGCTPLKSDAGLYDVITFLKTCYDNAYAALARAQKLIA